MADLKEAACKAFGLPPADGQLWDYYNCNMYSSDALDGSLLLANCNMIDDQDVLLTEKVIPHHPPTHPRPVHILATGSSNTRERPGCAQHSKDEDKTHFCGP
jgi:hypothetical protein